MRIYNLCDDQDNSDFREFYIHHQRAQDIRETHLFLYCIFHSNRIMYHKLDGPARKYRDTNGSTIEEYYIYMRRFSEKEYWEYPEIVKHKYLKEHPELEAFK